MLTLYQSNRLEILKSLLFEIMQRNQPENPIASQTIIVNDMSMANWLTISMATEFKIASGIEFTSPSNFLWQVYRKIIKQLPKENPFNSSVITWKIMSIIDDYIDHQNFIALKTYIQDNNQSELRKYQLAQSIAELFINYINYRPDLLVNWQNSGNKDINSDDNLWQPILWQALINANLQTNNNLNLATNILTIDNQLKNITAKSLPENIFLFGISSLPKTILQTLYLLAKTTNIHVFSTNPCEYYWGDNLVISKKTNKNIKTSSSHVLLDTMGKLGRDYFNSIHEIEATTIDAFSKDYPTTLLGNIQADIYQMLDNSQQPIDYNFVNDDDSFLVHSCHSQLRELQILHNRLLNWFANDPQLTPKDILVVMPDIHLYTPWINAVFSKEEYHDKTYIPYSVYSESNKHINNYADIVLQLLTLSNNRCTGENILEILAVKSVRNKFDLTIDEINIIRTWVKELNIRWGINTTHKNHFIKTANNFNTWEFGLQRLLLGHSMQESSGIYQDILPSEYANGQNSELIGKFADFLLAIDSIENSCPNQANIEDWLTWLNNSIENIYLLDDYEIENSIDVNKILYELTDILGDNAASQAINKDVLYIYLKNKLINHNKQHYISNGKLTFTNLTIMSSIPFKIICFLGMNSTDFPSRDTAVDFDLMAKKPRTGDESLKDRNKYAFLQALLAAETKVHISFIGQNINDNSIKLPSIIVEEILDYCKNSFKIEQSKLIYKHPLQPFSKNNFQNLETNFFSYGNTWVTTNYQPSVNTENILQPEPTKNLILTDLIKFFKDPVKHFYNNHFGVFFNDPEEILLDHEPFEIDNLQKYSLNKELIKLLLEKQNTTNFRKLNKAAGILPYSLFGNYLINDLEKNINKIVPKLNSLAVDLNANSKILIDLSAKYPFTVDAEITGLYQDNLVFIYPSKSNLKGKYIIEGWLSHLCCCYQQPTTTHILNIDKYNILNPISQQQALDYLYDLVVIYQQGLTRPLPWIADIGYKWLEKLKKVDITAEEDINYNCKHVIDEYINDSMNKRSCYYLTSAYPTSSYFEEFNLLTQNIMQPITEHLKSPAKSKDR